MKPEAQHDPGGRTRYPLPDHIRGDAAFSPCGRYRHALFRERIGDYLIPTSARTALFIGMNPSTAAADVDDPTCRREQAVAWREGCRFYVKANVMDWRATEPARLRWAGVVPRSDANLDWIARLARGARMDGGFAVAAWGALPAAQQPYATEALEVLKAAGVPLFCLGFTRAGHPRHPLYLASGAPLLPFPRGAT